MYFFKFGQTVMMITKILFLDVDGTITDGKLYIGNDGEVFKRI